MRKQKVITPKSELEFNSISSKQRIGYLRLQDEKLQGMLLWCSIAVLMTRQKNYSESPRLSAYLYMQPAYICWLNGERGGIPLMATYEDRPRGD